MSRRKLHLTPEQWEYLHALPKPRCPRDLSPEAKTIWKATAPGLKRRGYLTFVDAFLFRCYCMCVADHRRAVRSLTHCRKPQSRKVWASIERMNRRMANTAAKWFYLPKMQPLKPHSKHTRSTARKREQTSC